MDYQCLFDSDAYDDEGHYSKWTRSHGRPRPRPASKATFYSKEEEVSMKPSLPVRLLQFKHMHDASSIFVEDSVLTAQEIEKELSISEVGEFARLRLILTPPRETMKDEQGRLARYNPEALNPFDRRSFYRLVDTLHFHRACLSPLELGQMSTVKGPGNITSFYLETYSYRRGWYKASVSYEPSTMTTSVFLHNLSISDTKIVTSKLLSHSVQALTIHPMLLLVLVFELIFSICTTDLFRLFGDSISIQQSLGLHDNRMFAHFMDSQVDSEAAAKRSFGDGQRLAGLEERMEFSILAGKKLLSHFEKLNEITPDSNYKSAFVEAGNIIRSRLEFLVDGLELQMPRLRRAKAHTMLNQTGLENRTASDANKISQQIALESKADSTAMKAIAVLTMFFLPATFVAAFFAMPLFDWSAARGSDVVNHRFWVYWVVTVPGTILVLIAWRIWWRFESWNQQRDVQGESLERAAGAWVRTWWGRGLKREKEEKIEMEKTTVPT